jgi:hypothetical protein
MSPKTAKPLVELPAPMLKAIPLARQKYISVYGEDDLIETMADSLDRQADPEPSSDDPEPSSIAVDTPKSPADFGRPNSFKMNTSTKTIPT